MANPNRANGFQFVKMLDGSGKPTPLEYPLASSNEPLAKGDLVSFTSAGAVDRTCTDGGAAHNQTLVCGVVDSVKYKDATGRLINSTYVGAAQGDGTKTLGNGTGAIVRVLPLVGGVFSVQCDSGGSVAVSQTLIGNCADPVALEATDPTQFGVGGRSNMELDTSTASASAALFHIIGLDERPGMVFSATETESRYGRVLVTFNEHVLAQTPTAAGV